MIAEVFAKICELGISLGITRINELPGCWEYQIDDHWFIAVNAHSDPMPCVRDGSPVSVPPFHVYVEFNGWPAGLVSPNGGTLCAGEAANEATLIAAIEAATVRA